MSGAIKLVFSPAVLGDQTVLGRRRRSGFQERVDGRN
jgi:hypothetical protein